MSACACARVGTETCGVSSKQTRRKNLQNLHSKERSLLPLPLLLLHLSSLFNVVCSAPLLLFTPFQELGTKVEKEALETLRDTYHKTVKQVAVAEKDNRLMIVEIGRLRAELNETRLNAMRHGVNVMGGAAAANVSMLSTSLLLTRSFTGQ